MDCIHGNPEADCGTCIRRNFDFSLFYIQESNQFRDDVIQATLLALMHNSLGVAIWKRTPTIDERINNTPAPTPALMVSTGVIAYDVITNQQAELIRLRKLTREISEGLANLAEVDDTVLSPGTRKQTMRIWAQKLLAKK